MRSTRVSCRRAFCCPSRSLSARAPGGRPRPGSRSALMPEAHAADAIEDDLEAVARRGRLLVVESVANAGAGHIGGPLSAMDILVALFFRVLRIRPSEPDWPDRDRFILSKGHSAIGLYAVMAMRGYF